MKVLMLAYEAPEDFALRDEKSEAFDAYMGEWYKFSEGLKTKAPDMSSAALEQPSTATVISLRDGVRKVEDGPFPDTKEQLGGFFLIDAPGIDAAASWAADCPAAKTGFVDVRPVLDLGMGEEQ